MADETRLVPQGQVLQQLCDVAVGIKKRIKIYGDDGSYDEIVLSLGDSAQIDFKMATITLGSHQYEIREVGATGWFPWKRKER
jgi:hypothetical protein